jgi:hypothetical protein
VATSRSEKAVVGPGTSTYVPIKLIIGTKEGKKCAKWKKFEFACVNRYPVRSEFLFSVPCGLHLPVPH